MGADLEQFPLDSQDAMQRWAAAHNLNEIVGFHNVVRACLSEKAAGFGDDDIEHRIARSHLQNYMDYLANATFLMVYSYLEEDLHLLRKGHAKDVALGKAHSIKRYEPVLSSLGFDLEYDSWKFMLEATEIRHCLIHANRRMDHNWNRQRLENIVAKYPGELIVENSRLGVTVEFDDRYVREVRTFQDEVQRARLAHANPSGL